MKYVLIFLAIILSPAVLAESDHHPVPTIPKSLESMKKLLGTWEGTSEMGGKEHSMTVTYRLTSAGTAITETLMEGTPNEMVSVYHKDGGSMAMTHYCSLGNQPHMKLKKSDETSFVFEMGKPVGIIDPNEPHMHAVTLTLSGSDTLNQEWRHYAGGEEKQVVTFKLSRK